MLNGAALFSTQVIDCARTNSQSKKQNIKLPNDLAAQPLTGLGTAIVFICGMLRFTDIMSSKLKAGKIPAVQNVACILVPRVHLDSLESDVLVFTQFCYGYSYDFIMLVSRCIN